MTNHNFVEDNNKFETKNYLPCSQAGFIIRLFQYIIDQAIIWGLFNFIGNLFREYGSTGYNILYLTVCFAIYIAYYAVTIAFLSATLGMLATGLMVTDFNKKEVSLEVGLLRGIYMFTSCLTLLTGHLKMLQSKNKNTMVDNWSKSMVIINND